MKCMVTTPVQVSVLTRNILAIPIYRGFLAVFGQARNPALSAERKETSCSNCGEKGKRIFGECPTFADELAKKPSRGRQRLDRGATSRSLEKRNLHGTTLERTPKDILGGADASRGKWEYFIIFQGFLCK